MPKLGALGSCSVFVCEPHRASTKRSKRIACRVPLHYSTTVVRIAMSHRPSYGKNDDTEQRPHLQLYFNGLLLRQGIVILQNVSRFPIAAITA